MDLEMGKKVHELVSQPGKFARALNCLLSKTITWVLSLFTLRKWVFIQFLIVVRHYGSEHSMVERLETAGKIW